MCVRVCVCVCKNDGITREETLSRSEKLTGSTDSWREEKSKGEAKRHKHITYRKRLCGLHEGIQYEDAYGGVQEEVYEVVGTL